jgi:hypothetical protein
MFNLLEHCNKFDHTEELKRHWGLAIQWVTPRCYSVLLIDDDLGRASEILFLLFIIRLGWFKNQKVLFFIYNCYIYHMHRYRKKE